MAGWMGIRLLSKDETGRGVVMMPLEDRQLNKIGLAHGGAVFTLADMACVAGCFGLGLSCVTSQCSISYLAPGRQGPLRAEAVPVKVGRTIAVFDVLVTDAGGNKVAKAVMNCFITGTREFDPALGY